MSIQETTDGKFSAVQIYKFRIKQLLEKSWLPYVLPFALFLLLTAPVGFFPALRPFFYIAKTLIVGALLWFWRQTVCGRLFLRSLHWRVADGRLLRPPGAGHLDCAGGTSVSVRPELRF